MSGTQVSSFPSQNILFDAASGQALQRGQANAQALGANEMEYLARAAQGILSASGGDEAKLAELYPAAVADLQRYGFARNAPAVSPGKAAIERIAALGTSSATLGEQRGNLAANASFVSGIKGAQPNALMTPAPGAATPGATTSSTPTEPDYSVPRGTRNNNPLNLSFANQPGATMENHPNPRFAAFATPEEGVSAAVNQLKLYQSRGNSTLRGMISTWAPPSENDTEAYVRRVTQTTGLDPDKPVDLNDPAVASKLVQAMARHETGRPLDPTIADRGVSAPVAPRGVAARTGGVDVAGPTGTVPGTPPAPGVTPPAQQQPGQQQAATTTQPQQTAATDVNVPPAGTYTPSQIQDFETLARRPKTTPADLINLRAKFDDDNEKARQNALTRQRQGAADARQAEQDRIAADKRVKDEEDRQRKIEDDRQAALRAGRKDEADALAAQAAASKVKFDQANALRDEATKITETFRPMQEAKERIDEAAKAGNALGDLGLIYTYTRLLDPATVHEEEIKRGMKAGGLGEYVSGWLARVTKGESLTPAVRQQFVEMARRFYDVRKKGYDQELGRYRSLAEKFGLDPDTVAVSLARDQGPPPLPAGFTVVQ